MNVEKAVGMELNACRRKRRISQEQLGFDAGVHRTYVSLIERGVKSPTLGVLFRLCRALDVASTIEPSPDIWLTRCHPADSLAMEYRGLFGDTPCDVPDSLQHTLTYEAEWTPEAAEHLVRLATAYGSFMLRNALAISLALDIEDGELGF